MCFVTTKIQGKVINFLKKHNLVDKNNIILVGFSGGIDSACLLDVLFRLPNEYKFKIIAGHLNHNWRGEESKKEELNAQNFCNQRNIEFYSETLPDNLPRTEEEARKQRYLFFNKIAVMTNTTAIFTGHTLSDQIETVLYRIIKGTGISGLKGIPEVRYQENLPSIYRPLLEISREETIKYCEENNIEPNIDSSNLEEKYLRNKIRLSLIPELCKCNSGVENAVLRLSCIAKDTEEIVEEYLHLINKEIYLEDDIISTSKFVKLSSALQKRIIFDLLIKNKIDYHYEKINDALSFINESSDLKSGNTLSLGENIWLFASSSEIRLINKITAEKFSEIIPVNPEGETFFPFLNKTLKITPYKGEKPDKYPKEEEPRAFIDLSKVNPPLFLRTRRDGDRIQPFGLNSKIKLKKYLINKGIPEFKRDELLLLTDEKEVLWVAGVGISELLRVNIIPTHELMVY